MKTGSWALFFLIPTLLWADQTRPFTFGLPNQVVTMSPFIGTGSSLWKIHKLIYDFLVVEKPGEPGTYLPALATSWKISKDKLIYEFTLRENVLWHDGTPLSVEDVVFSLEHLFDSKYKSLWKGSYEGIKKIEIMGPLKIRITTMEPRFELWKSIAVDLRILPKHFYTHSADFNKTAVGTGPYKLSHFESGRSVSLEKNPHWWGNSVSPFKDWYKLEKIQFRSFLDPSLIPSYFQKGEIDFYPSPDVQLVKSIKVNKKIPAKTIEDPNYNDKTIEFLKFNLADPILQDIRIREALNKLIDRKTICYKTFPESVPALAEWDNIPASKTKTIEYSKEKGLKLLADTGWKDTDQDGILEKFKNNKKLNLELEVIYSSDEARYLAILAENLKNYGIRLKLRKVDDVLIWKLMHEKNFQLYATRASTDSPILKSMYHSSGFYNNQSLNDKKIDLEIGELDQEFDYKKRQKKTQSLRTRISDAIVNLFLCKYDNTDYLVHERHELSTMKRGSPYWAWFR